MHNSIHHKDLLECRKQFGPPGLRKFPLMDRLFYLNIKRPDWCTEEEALWQLFENKQDVFKYGNIVWGHIVQANTLLFEPGEDDCPASVLFCPDPKQVIHFETLQSAAQRMFQLKNTTPSDPELLKIAQALTNEVTRTFGVKVPQQFSDGFSLYQASTFIARKHLPNGVLSRPLFPLLVNSKSPFYCFPLPSQYWSNSLVEDWIR